ncbi:hypothetical protein V8G54_007826 [Vigna mungo]|uniref:Uncharacterized protein n=1 Tax=Vigna mungo TaxID=3915 RepID=A0AAQ3P2E4_VIGMU
MGRNPRYWSEIECLGFQSEGKSGLWFGGKRCAVADLRGGGARMAADAVRNDARQAGSGEMDAKEENENVNGRWLRESLDSSALTFKGLKSGVYKDCSEGIVCYQDERGEIICEVYDEGLYFKRIQNLNNNYPREEGWDLPQVEQQLCSTRAKPKKKRSHEGHGRMKINCKGRSSGKKQREEPRIKYLWKVHLIRFEAFTKENLDQTETDTHAVKNDLRRPNGDHEKHELRRLDKDD